MPNDLATLETQRSKLLEEFLDLGDLRQGSISAVTRRCGKPSCHCGQNSDPGHDPQFRLTRRVAGKTVTESSPNPTTLRKAQQEVAEFHSFQKLSQDLVTLNEEICGLRPLEQQPIRWTEQEKKTVAAIHQEVARLPGLCATPEGRPDRSGNCRVGLVGCSAPSGRCRLNRTAAVRGPRN
jgi:hypothetical protein